MFGNNSLRVTVLSLWPSKERNNRFVFNEIRKLINIKLLVFRFDKRNFMLSINAAMLKHFVSNKFVKFALNRVVTRPIYYV